MGSLVIEFPDGFDEQDLSAEFLRSEVHVDVESRVGNPPNLAFLTVGEMDLVANIEVVYKVGQTLPVCTGGLASANLANRLPIVPSVDIRSGSWVDYAWVCAEAGTYVVFMSCEAYLSATTQRCNFYVTKNDTVGVSIPVTFYDTASWATGGERVGVIELAIGDFVTLHGTGTGASTTAINQFRCSIVIARLR